MRTFATSISVTLGAAAVLVAVIFNARSQDDDAGKTGFLQNCAGCHGADGKGAGPLSAKLKTKPPDLTLLAKRNHGTFDAAAVYQMIDGRNVRPTHHSAEMPIWGCRYENPPPPAITTTKHNRKIPKRIVTQMKNHESELDSLLDLPCGSEDAVRARIRSIVDYLSQLQAK